MKTRQNNKALEICDKKAYLVLRETHESLMHQGINTELLKSVVVVSLRCFITDLRSL